MKKLIFSQSLNDFCWFNGRVVPNANQSSETFNSFYCEKGGVLSPLIRCTDGVGNIPNNIGGILQMSGCYIIMCEGDDCYYACTKDEYLQMREEPEPYIEPSNIADLNGVVESDGIKYIKQFIKKDEYYKDVKSYPFYTKTTPHGNCATMIWVCNDCGFTSSFSYRNDMNCSNGIYFCKDCGSTQVLNSYYSAAYNLIRCLVCDSSKLEAWDGKICPKCGGHIIQFNGIVSNSKLFSNFLFNNIYKDHTLEKNIRDIEENK